MPLNLLHHKSWHVYNAKNQERVRKDEHEAQLKEEEEERRMQEVDAERRMLILRDQMEGRQRGAAGGGDEPGSIPYINDKLPEDNYGKQIGNGASSVQPAEPVRKRRKLSPAPSSGNATAGSQTRRAKREEAPLVGPDGHINLFPSVHEPKDSSGQGGKGRPKSSQNPEYLADKAREEAAFDAQYTMKISEPSRPWYASVDKVSQVDREKEEKKKQWEERVETRVRESNDPLNAMKSGLRQLKGQREDTARDKKRRDAEMGMGIDQRLLSRRDIDRNDRDRYPASDNSRNQQSHRDFEQRSEVSSRDRRRGQERGGDKRSNDPDSRRESSRGDERHRRRHRNSSHRRHHSSKRDRSRSVSSSPSGKPRRSRSRSRSRSVSVGLSSSKRLRSPSGKDRKHRSHLGSNAKDPSPMERLREEQQKREQTERLKMEALLETEKRFRNPEVWSVTSSSSGHGRYSRQFGS